MSKVLMLIVLSGLMGCGGGTPSSEGGASSSSSSSNSTSSSSSGAISESIDCESLDPDKVYIFGTLQENERLYAIADIEDPTNFCVGFDKERTYKGVINSSGNYVYAVSSFESEPLLSMIPDELVKDVDDRWVYPSFASSDDTVLFTPPNEGCGLLTIDIQPVSDEIYYSCPNQLINTRNSQPLYDIGSNSENRLLTVLPNGGMLVADDPEGIKYVDPNLNETYLTMPSDVRYIFGNAKQFIDPSSGNLSVWIAAASNLEEFYSASAEHREELFRRLKVDMTTMEVVDEGGFMPLPSGFVATYFEGEFDGDGNLYQPGRATADLDDDWIVKRSIELGGSPSIVVYKESDHYLREIYNGPEDLCTEQELLFGDTDDCNDGVYDWRDQDNLFVKYDRRLITGM